MRKIYQKDILYHRLRPLVDHTVRTSFRRITVRGEENIPSDGAIIYAPNHCNTLMDALVVLQAYKGPTAFGARADIFRKPLVGKLLRRLKMVPIPRRRDSLREVEQNRAVMDEIAECLEHGVRYCLFGEGTHRTMHSLLPIRKGVIRTAWTASERFGDRQHVHIVPVGLDYSDYFRFRNSVTISYGKPMDVTAYLNGHKDALESDIYRSLSAWLSGSIASLITYLPDDEHYEGRWLLTRLAGTGAAMQAAPELIREAAEFDRQRKEEKISLFSFGRRHPAMRLAGKLLVWCLLLPVSIFCAITAAPLTITAQCIRGKIKDKAFTNTVRFGTKLALQLPVIIIWSVIFALTLPWQAALPLCALTLVSHSFYYEMMEMTRIMLSDLRLMCGHRDLKSRYAHLAEALRPGRPVA